MKKIVFILMIIVISAVIVQCEKEKQENQQLGYVQAILGGCNGHSFDEIMLPRYEETDTLQFYLKNDTLNVFIGINYICCAPFEANFEQSGDSLFFTITDTCPFPYESCYCRCMCLYTFAFLFDSFAKKEYHFRIVIDDPRQDEPYIFRQGTVDLSSK